MTQDLKMPQPAAPPPMSTLGPVLIGLGVIALVFGGGGVAANYMEIDQSVIVPAEVTLDANPVPISVDELGLVEEVLVSEGDVVEAGQLVMRLKSEDMRIELNNEQQSLILKEMRFARLEAELAREETFPAPDVAPDLVAFTGRYHAIESAVLRQRLAALNSAIDVLDTEAVMFQEQSERLSAEIDQMEDMRASYQSEIDDFAPLVEEGIVRRTQQSDRERQLMTTAREIEALKTRQLDAGHQSVAKSKERAQMIADWDRAAAEGLQEVASEIAVLQSRVASLEERLSRRAIHARADGVVFQLQARHAGYVVQPSEPIMQIVPLEAKIVARGRLAVDDLDDIRAERTAIIQLVAHSGVDVPKMDGEILRIAPHSITDPEAGMSFFEIDVELKPELYRDLVSADPTPGEPLQVLVPVNRGTLFSILAEPVTSRLPEVFQR